MKTQQTTILSQIFILALLISECSNKKNISENVIQEMKWLAKIEQIQVAVETNFNTKRLPNKLLGPATNLEIEGIEKKLKQDIPKGLKHFFLTESKYAYMNWSIPEEYEMPYQIEYINGGGIEIGLDILVEMNRSYKETIDQYYIDPNNDYNKTLHNKFVFHTTWSGDFFAIDLTNSNFGKVLYLSYNEAPGHNYVLGDSFENFIENWTELGFVGPEGGDLLYFMSNKLNGLNSNSENARLLKKLINK